MIKGLLKSLFKTVRKLEAWVEEAPTPNTNNYSKSTKTLTLENGARYEQRTPRFKVANVWDYLKFKEDTQAYHISQVLAFDEWTSMEEILRRVKELFQVEYKNERSLYPYLKTLVDSGLLEVNVTGGKMRWRKKSLMISIDEEEVVVNPLTQTLQ